MVGDSPLKNKVILAFNDKPDVLDLLEEKLDMSRVVKKKDYDDTVAYLEAHHPNLVIFDIMGVNGFDLLQICAENKLPAVILTAHELTLDTLKKSIEMGARAYLPKEKIADMVPFLEDVLTKRHRETWQRLFDRLCELIDATFGTNQRKNLIEMEPFIVTK
jgi:DNA-binding NtrC family response regulator